MWEKGRKLQIAEVELSDEPEKIDLWWKELNELRNHSHDATDAQGLESALHEADRTAKDQV